MAAIEISGKQKWEREHNFLNQAIEKEIYFMREALANFHEEEFFLLEQDMRKWRKAIYERSDLVVQLKKQRSKRVEATKNLSKLLEELNRTELFPAEEETSCEILNKIDQILALIERINLQNCKNEVLFAQNKQKKPKPAYSPFHMVKKKTSIATYT